MFRVKILVVGPCEVIMLALKTGRNNSRFDANYFSLSNLQNLLQVDPK